MYQPINYKYIYRMWYDKESKSLKAQVFYTPEFFTVSDLNRTINIPEGLVECEIMREGLRAGGDMITEDNLKDVLKQWREWRKKDIIVKGGIQGMNDELIKELEFTSEEYKQASHMPRIEKP